MVSNLYEMLISTGYQVGYVNRKKELILPEVHEDIALPRCLYCSKFCHLSTFQFRKVEDNMIHVHTTCFKGVLNYMKKIES